MRQCVVAEPIATAADFYNTLEVLQKLVVPQVPGNMAATLQQLIDQARRMNQCVTQPTCWFTCIHQSNTWQMKCSSLLAIADLLYSFCSVPAQKLNDSGDPPELRAQVGQLFDDWIRISDELPRDEAHDAFVARLQQLGFLKVIAFLGRCCPASIRQARQL